jgi:hypothetical protein
MNAHRTCLLVPGNRPERFAWALASVLHAQRMLRRANT